MATILMRATLNECDEIASGKKTYTIRGADRPCRCGDVLRFTPYKDGKPTRHATERMLFEVTHIGINEPIDKGMKIICFRRKI